MAVKTKNHEFEKLILKGILSSRDLAKKILGRGFVDEIFDHPLHKFLFKSANERYEKSSDLISFEDVKYIVDKNTKDEKEKSLRLNSIENLKKDLDNVKDDKSRYSFCWEELLRLYQTRKFFDIIDKGIDQIKDNPNADPLKVISDVERMFYGIRKGSNQVLVDKENIFDQTSINKRVERYVNEEGKPINRGLPYFLPKLTEVTGGIKPTDLILFGARQKVGKSITLLNQAVYLTKLGYNVAYISIEQSKEEITLRADSLATELRHIDIKLRKLDDHNRTIYQAKLQELTKNGKFFVIDIPRNCSVNLIEREVKDLIDQGNVLNCIIVDYLGLLNPSSETDSHHLAVGLMTKQLKELCREIKIPIITAQQLTRNSEKEKTKTGAALAMSDQIASHVDYFFCLVPQLEGRMEIQTVLARDSEPVTVQCLTSFDKMMIMELKLASSEEDDVTSFEDDLI
jgi:replicative DNA helicase